MSSNFHNMDQHPAYGKLQKCALAPFDLTAQGALSPQRIAHYDCRMASFKLLYGTQRVDEQTLDLLQELADQSGVVEQFKMMKRGEVMNRIEGYDSENRQVLHTACRDMFSTDPYNHEATRQAECELEKLRTFLGDLDGGRIVNYKGEPFSNLINIGIGGSDLGSRAV